MREVVQDGLVEFPPNQFGQPLFAVLKSLSGQFANADRAKPQVQAHARCPHNGRGVPSVRIMGEDLRLRCFAFKGRPSFGIARSGIEAHVFQAGKRWAVVQTTGEAPRHVHRLFGQGVFRHALEDLVPFPAVRREYSVRQSVVLEHGLRGQDDVIVKGMKGDAAVRCPAGHLFIPSHGIGGVVPVGVDGLDLMPGLSTGFDSLGKRFLRRPVEGEELTAGFGVGGPHAAELGVDEPHAGIALGKAIEDVAVKAKEADRGQAGIQSCGEAAVVMGAQVAAVPEQGDGRHGGKGMERARMRQPGREARAVSKSNVIINTLLIKNPSFGVRIGTPKTVSGSHDFKKNGCRPLARGLERSKNRLQRNKSVRASANCGCWNAKPDASVRAGTMRLDANRAWAASPNRSFKANWGTAGNTCGRRITRERVRLNSAWGTDSGATAL